MNTSHKKILVPVISKIASTAAASPFAARE
jgi:hypothetical protein